LPVALVPSPSWTLAMRLRLNLNVVFNDACYSRPPGNGAIG
jgi:hypothetical protein